MCSESLTSVSAPIQYAAVEAYKGDHSAYLNAVRKILSFTGNYVYENLKSHVINIAKPEGGFYLFPEFTNAIFTSSNLNGRMIASIFFMFLSCIYWF